MFHIDSFGIGIKPIKPASLSIDLPPEPTYVRARPALIAFFDSLIPLGKTTFEKKKKKGEAGVAPHTRFQIPPPPYIYLTTEILDKK